MQTTRSEKLDLRLTPEAKRTLNIAASAAGRSVSEFVLEMPKETDKKGVARRETLGREQLAAMTSAPAGGAAAEHDDE